MIKKRLVGVITVRDGWAVQSFGYQRHLPLGHPECLAENLDRWGVDEIMVLGIDRRRRGLGPDFSLVRRLGALGLSTPLTYGGGIGSPEDAGEVIQSGADRVCVDTMLRMDHDGIRRTAALVGAQAVIGVLPLSVEAGALRWHDHVAGTDSPLSDDVLALFAERVLSEAVLIDWRHEGYADAFDAELVRCFPMDNVPLILFGGLSNSHAIGELLRDPRVAAAGVGNFLTYREHEVQRLKIETGDHGMLRPATFDALR